MSARTRLAVVVAVFLAGLLGWSLGGYLGATVGVLVGVSVAVVRWWRLPLWSWWALFRRRNRAIELDEPITVANDRSGGGVRYQDNVAIVAVQILGKAHTPRCSPARRPRTPRTPSTWARCVSCCSTASV